MFVDFLSVAEAPTPATREESLLTAISMTQLCKFAAAVRLAPEVYFESLLDPVLSRANRHGTSALGIAATKLSGWLHFKFLVPGTE